MFPGDNSLEYYQSEQSVIRAIDAITREPLLVVGFNDGAGEFDASGRPLIEKNRMGYARMADSASAWVYGRVPVLSATPGHRVTTANGDPWLATNRSRDRIYYANLGLGSGAGSNAPNALLVSVHDDGATSGFWRAPFTGDEIENQLSVSMIRTERGTDKPSIAVSPDQAEDVYLAWTCPLAECDPGRINEIRLLRVIGQGSRLVQTAIVEAPGTRVQNPVLAVDPHEPSSVFVAYQVLVREDPDEWAVRVAKSPNRGGVFFLIDISGSTAIRPDPTIETVGPLPMRNGIFMDYFASDDGWHYAVWENRGEVYLARAEPAPPGDVVGNGSRWGPPQRLAFSNPNRYRDFQPAVTATGSRVAIVHYEQERTSALTTVLAWISENRGVSWRPPAYMRDEAGAMLTFEPCPVNNRIETAYYGDYIDVVPMTLPGVPSDEFFAAWTDSRLPAGETGEPCAVSTSNNAVHQHTYGAVFR